MAQQTINATLAQDGVRSAGAWSEAGGIGVEESLGQVGGFRFTGLPTTSPNRGEFISASATLEFSLPSVGAGQVPATVSIYARMQRDPSAYATANLPPLLTEITPLSDIEIATQATISSAGAQTLSFSLDTAALDSARYAGGALYTFSGFAFHLHARTADGTALTVGQSEDAAGATLEYVLDTVVFTGIEIEWDRLAESRPDICPICGDESLREEWVWCELHDRHECPGCADPDVDALEQVPASGNDLVGED